ADRRALGVGGAEGAPAAAGLGHVARARRGPAHGARGHEGVGWTAVGHSIAELGHVARPDGRPADAGGLDVGRAGRGDAGARLRRVAAAGRRTADGAGDHEVVRGTAVADAVAALGDVARTGRRPTDRRALHVGRTRGVAAGAALGDVAHA